MARMDMNVNHRLSTLHFAAPDCRALLEANGLTGTLQAGIQITLGPLGDTASRPRVTLAVLSFFFVFPNRGGPARN